MENKQIDSDELLIKNKFIKLLYSNDFNLISDEMIQYVNDLFIINNKYYYLLHFFLDINEYNIVKWLLNLPNILVNCQNIKNETPLHIAIDDVNIDIDIIKLLLNNKDINVNIIDNNGGNTPLHIAVFENVNIINLLLNDKNINANIQNYDNETPLHLAFKVRDNEDIINLLIDNIKIDVNIINGIGETPLHIACNLKKYDIIKKLINKIDYNNENNKDVLYYVISSILNNYLILSNYKYQTISNEIISLILNKIIENKKEITVKDYIPITCWSTINYITLNLFNNFITEYHINFPDLKKRYEYAKNHYDNIIQTGNYEQYIISGHGSIINNYFIVPSNVMIIMQTSVENYGYSYKINNNMSITPPCNINKNYNEYINSILKIKPIVYLSGSLIKNNRIFFNENTNIFTIFLGILNIEQITHLMFSLQHEEINYIKNWNSLNDNNNFRLKYTNQNILTIDEIKQNNFRFELSNIIKIIKNKFPNKKIILHISACRTCNTNNDYMEDICKTEIQQIPIMKTKHRGSFSLASIENEAFDVLQSTYDNFQDINTIENELLQSTHNKFKDIFDFVIDNSTDPYDSNSSNIQYIKNKYDTDYTLSNNDVCDILKEYIKLKN